MCEKAQKNKFFCHDIKIMIIFVCLLFRIMEGNIGRAFHYHAPVVRMEPARKGFVNGDELVNCR